MQAIVAAAAAVDSNVFNAENIDAIKTQRNGGTGSGKVNNDRNDNGIFDGFVMCLTGIAVNEKNQLHTIIQELGGQLSIYVVDLVVSLLHVLCGFVGCCFASLSIVLMYSSYLSFCRFRF